MTNRPTFSNDLTFSTKATTDVATSGVLIGKSPQETQILKKEMATNNYQWANERDNSRRQACMIEMNALNMLSAQMNNVVKLLSKQTKFGSNSTSNVSVSCCNICGGDHNTNICVESVQAQFVNNYNRTAQNNP